MHVRVTNQNMNIQINLLIIILNDSLSLNVMTDVTANGTSGEVISYVGVFDIGLK